MKSSLAILLPLLLLSGCSGGPSLVKDQLQSVWFGKNVSAFERCAAVNAHFTNGTPMRDVVAVLGPQDTMISTTTLSDTPNQRVWVYRFGAEDVYVNSAGGPTTPL